MKSDTFFFCFFLLAYFSCTDLQEKKSNQRGPHYVSPTIDKYGHFRSGSVRMPVSTNKNAIKNQNRSRYYYQTRGKYSRGAKH